MSIKTKKQALDSIHKRSKVVGGKTYDSFVCYVGTDPVEHKKIMFESSTKDGCIKAVSEFFDTINRGASPAFARSLSARDMAELTLVRSMLADAGIAGTSLVTIVQDYIGRAGSIVPCTLGDALDKYLDTFSDVQVVHRRCIENRVGQFVRSIGACRKVHEIAPRDIASYADKELCNVAPKTWNNHISYIKSFFSWCCRKDVGYRLDNPAADMRQKQIAYKEPEFVTADKVRAVFDAVDKKTTGVRRSQLLAFLALSFFNGIRTDEIFRLDGRDIDVTDGWIRVAMPKGFQRGIAPRMVQLTDAAKAWLVYSGINPHAGTSLLDDIPSADAVHKSILRAAPDVDLPHNAGRHSFITMHVALYGNPTQTEAICGTSKQMRTRNYMGLATRKQAEEYFSVMPKQTEE